MVQSSRQTSVRPTLDGVKVAKLARPGGSEVTYVVLPAPAAAKAAGAPANKGEKRTHRRWRTHLRSGKIVDGGAVILAESQVRDRSTRGARLRIASPVALPRHIRFFDDVTKSMFEAAVAWQRGREIGIAFLREVDLRGLTAAERFRLGLRTPVTAD